MRANMNWNKKVISEATWKGLAVAAISGPSYAFLGDGYSGGSPFVAILDLIGILFVPFLVAAAVYCFGGAVLVLPILPFMIFDKSLEDDDTAILMCGFWWTGAGFIPYFVMRYESYTQLALCAGGWLALWYVIAKVLQRVKRRH